MGVGSLISTAVNNKFGTKFCLVLGGSGNVIWILTTTLASKYQDAKTNDPDSWFANQQLIESFLFFSSMCNGLAVGILWSSANSYVASCANDHNKGFFFSFYWSFYMTS
jgi:MFS family permease